MRLWHALRPYLRLWVLKAGNHQENRPSAFHWVVWEGGGADFYLLSFPISVSNLPFSIFQTGTASHTQRHPHTLRSLCSEYLPWLITQKSKAIGKGRWKAGETYVFSTSSFLFFPVLMTHLSKFLLLIHRWKFALFGCQLLRLVTETSDLRSWPVICCTRQTFLIGA